ncbi:MAG: hypothetical protein RL648_1261 [Verrucomicrobiota bacterium]
MKFLVSQFSYFLSDQEARRNLKALRTYLSFLVAIMLLYTVLFHVLMEHFEGQQHSWLTGFYWTLTVMSTLGFGDITFHSDVGRLFSIIVLISGVVLLLIMLPFAFIRYFYAPWLEAQLRARVPREVPHSMSGHVIIARQDAMTNNLVRKLKVANIPHCIIEKDPLVATEMRENGLHAVVGNNDDVETYHRLGVERARLLVANADDPTNTNILLTVRSVCADIPILAVAEEEDSVDIFALSGAEHPVPLKVRLGEHLATRVSVGVGSAHEVGRYNDLRIVEFLVHDTQFEDRALRETGLREKTGMNMIGIWEAGKLLPVRFDTNLSKTSVPVAIGTEAQVMKLNQMLRVASPRQHEVLVIGGGKVGRCTARALKEREVRVRLLDADPSLEAALKPYCDEVIIGNGADRETLERAGINEVSAVALTTNDDAQNIHLAVYCRRLRNDLSIVSRMTLERNIEAIYRAGADYVLGYASLGCEFVMATLLGREPVMVGEGADLFTIDVPSSLVGNSLGESGIGSQTGLVVIAVESDRGNQTNPTRDFLLEAGQRLVMLGTEPQIAVFNELFGRSA